MKAMEIQSIKVHFPPNTGWIIVGLIVALISGAAIAEGKWLYLGVPLASLVIFISIKNPIIFPLGIYVLLLPFDSLLSITGREGATFTKFIGILTIGILSLKGAFEKKLAPPDNVSRWWTFFVLFSFLSVIWAIEPGLMTSTIFTMSGLLILYLVVASYRVTRNDFDTIKWFILCSGFLAAMAIIYEFATGMMYYSFRVALFLEDRVIGPNKLAFDMLFPLSIAIAMILEKRPIMTKITLLSVIGVIVFGLLLSGSRGGMAGALAILMVYMVYSKKRMTLGIIIAAVALIAIPMVPDFIADRIADSAGSRGDGREDIWVVGLKALEKYWLLGSGQNNFGKAYTEFANNAPIFRGLDRASHNLFLGVFVELGIVGLSLMVIAIIKHYQILRLRTNKYCCENDRIMLKAVFFGMLVSSLSLDTFFYKSFWLLWMMILVYKNVLTRESRT